MDARARRTRSALVAGLLLSGTVAAAPQSPAQPQRPVFKTSVNLVTVEVVVLDADGRPVRGLTKDDFRVFDRSVQQEIATFTARTHEVPPAGIFPAGVPLDVADNRSAKSDRLVIIVLDDLHFRGRTAEAAAIVQRVIEELGDSVSLGLVTTSGTFGVEPTEDRVRLLRALEAFLDRYDPARVKLLPPTPGPAWVPPGTPGDLDPPIYIASRGPRDLASSFSSLHTYKTVEDVARMAGAKDGRRKAFVWVSAGVEGAYGYYETCKSAEPAGGAHAGGAICGMFEKLFRSSVTLYSVSPGGPTDGGRSLQAITEDTGGFSIQAEDIDVGIAQILDELDNYYVLGFYPAEPGRDDFRLIDVLVKGEGLTVRHRIGYHVDGPLPPPKNKSPLGALVAPVTPKTDLHLRLGAVPLLTKGSDLQVLATIEVDLGALPDVDAAGLVRDELQFAVFAVDLKKKKVTRSAARRILLDWPPEHRVAGAERFRIQTVLTMPPGAYQLRASTISKGTERSGGVYLQIDVPPVAERALVVGGIALAGSATTEPRVVERKPLQALALPFEPSLDREFAPDDTLRVFFQVRRPHINNPATGVARLLDDAGVEAARVPWNLASGAPGEVSLQIPLAGVAPGPYSLAVSAAIGAGLVAADRAVALRIVSR